MEWVPYDDLRLPVHPARVPFASPGVEHVRIVPFATPGVELLLGDVLGVALLGRRSRRVPRVTGQLQIVQQHCVQGGIAQLVRETDEEILGTFRAGRIDGTIERRWRWVIVAWDVLLGVLSIRRIWK